MMQAQVNPALGALLQTAQMVTPEQTPTVAAQVAQVAAQKMQPQGIMGGMPQATQDFRTAAQIDNMKRMQMQQAMQQMASQMTARPAGIEGLPAQNMQTFAAAQGGVVGYASRGYVDPQLPDVYEDYIRSTGEERTGREEEELFGPMKTERQRAIEAAEEELLGPATRERLAAAPPRPAPANRPSAPTPRPPTPAPRPPAPANRPPAAAPAPTGIAAALAERPQYDVASIPAAGTPYMKAGEEDVARLRKAEGERAAFEKTLPDLSAKGIAALEASEQERQRLLGVQRGDDKFNRQIALLRGFQGDRSAYDRVVANQQARDDLARQAQLSFEQARIKEMQAQQARQLNQFDRAIALEREAAALMEKARDNALKAQQIQQGIASAQYEGAVKMRGQDIGVEEGAKERASRERIARESIAARVAGAGARGAITPKDLAKFRMQAEQQVDKALQEDMAFRRLRNDPIGQAAYREDKIKARVREALLAADYDLPAGYEKAPAPAAGAAMPPGNWGKAQVVTP